ncbi:hypothetical protein EC960109_1553A, partial [Escherichia coli 96.0109]
MDNFL